MVGVTNVYFVNIKYAHKANIKLCTKTDDNVDTPVVNIYLLLNLFLCGGMLIINPGDKTINKIINIPVVYNILFIYISKYIISKKCYINNIIINI